MPKAREDGHAAQNPTIQRKACETHTLQNTRVVDSKKKDDKIWRRRHCLKCGETLYSEEVLIEVGSRADIREAKNRKPKPPKKNMKKKPVYRYGAGDIDALSDTELEDALVNGWINPDELDNFGDY